MTVETLFGTEEINGKARKIKFKQIKAVYETLAIKEEITDYISPHERYASPIQIFETFRFLNNETKEYFFTLHLDGNNRNVCIDMVSAGSLNQSIEKYSRQHSFPTQQQLYSCISIRQEIRHQAEKILKSPKDSKKQVSSRV